MRECANADEEGTNGQTGGTSSRRAQTLLHCIGHTYSSNALAHTRTHTLHACEEANRIIHRHWRYGKGNTERRV